MRTAVQSWILEMFFKLRNGIGRVLPYRMVYGIGVIVGDLLYFLLSSRRKIALENLMITLHLDMRHAVLLTRRVFRNLGLTVAETLLIPYITDRFVGNHVEIEGEKYLKEAINQQHGVIVFTGHFGNWELLGGIISKLGYPLNAVAQKQTSWLGNEILSRVRAQYGESISGRGTGWRRGYRALRQGEILALLADQDARDHGWFVEFLDRPASTFPGPVLLAQRTGAPIVPIFHIRIGSSKHKVIVYPAVHIAPDASHTELQQHLQNLTRVLEDLVYQYPEQWFWIHRRWKSQPLDKENSVHDSSRDL